MFPASTYNGGAVLAFPDVCKTPAPPAPPVAAPYPGVGSKQGGKAGKPVAGSKKPVAAKDATQSDLLQTLDDLHASIKSMHTRDASAWHEAVDNYVMAVAAVYMSGKNVTSQITPHQTKVLP